MLKGHVTVPSGMELASGELHIKLCVEQEVWRSSFEAHDTFCYLTQAMNVSTTANKRKLAKIISKIILTEFLTFLVS